MATPQFRTRPDGTVYPLTPPKGRWPGRVLGATAVAIVLAAGGSIGVAGGTAAIGARSATSVSSAKAKARNRDARAVVQRLVRQGFRVEGEFSSDDDDCVAHSYGRVREFFCEHRCDGVLRQLIEVRDRRGGLALIAVAWVDMPDVDSARQLKALVDVHGTGNITELNRGRGRYRTVRFAGEHYESTREGGTVVTAQAEPIGRTAIAAGLAELAVDAASRR
jgi:hypothetical protein